MRPPQPFESCPRWQHCSVNNCPLSPNYPEGYTHTEDSQKKCTLPKSYRRKIAEKFSGILRYEGLTLREFNGEKAWRQMSVEKRAICTTQIKNLLEGVASQKEVFRQDETQGRNEVNLEAQKISKRVYKEIDFSEQLDQRGCN